jgi:CBS-domain-containing membrane protein
MRPNTEKQGIIARMQGMAFVNKVVVPAVGGLIGIAAMIAFDRMSGVPLMMVPFATSIVLVMATPLSLFARPRNIVGGHLLSAVAGFAILWSFGSNPWLAAPAVGLAIALMQMTNTLHPPAGINPFIIVTMAPGWEFFFIPVAAGAVLLVALAWLYHKVTQPGVYPIRQRKSE